MKFRLLLLTGLWCAGWVQAAEDAGAAAPAEEDAGLKISNASDKIYLLEGKGGNVGVSVGEDGMLIVDDQFDSEAGKIAKALEYLGPGALKYVLNTHFHSDHVGGNTVFGAQAPIIAHTNVRKRLQADGTAGLPVITFDESVSLHFNGEEIRVIHFSEGHTDGDAIVFFKGSNVVHMGDHFFSGRFPFIDLNSGGDVRGYIANVASVLEALPKDAVLIPGHGPLSTVGDLKEFHEMLLATSAIVEQQILAGKKLEDIQAASLPAPWSTWSWEFIDTDRWLEILYNGLTKRK